MDIESCNISLHIEHHIT